MNAQREIKFRAWDIVTMKMATGVVIHENGMAFTNDGQGDEVILMQYTGLKDKNGKEIYEGDVVELHGTRRLEVHFFGGAFGWTGMMGVDDFIPFSRDRIRLEKLLSWTQVIGNIHENPELLIP